MDAEEVRKIIREELEVNRKKENRTAGAFRSFALWVGSITLASFFFTYWAARKTLPDEEVDWAAATFLLIAVVAVFLAIAYYRNESKRAG